MMKSRQLPVTQAGGALLFLHGHPGPVAHILIGSREGVEQSGLAAVGVARQGDAHGAAVVGAVVIGALVLLQFVDMVLELLAGALRVGAAGGGLPGGGAAGRADADLSGVILPQGQLIATERDLQRVAQGSYLGHLYCGPRSETHIHQPALDRPRLVAHRQDHAALSGGELLEGAGGIGLLLFHDAPSFRSRGWSWDRFGFIVTKRAGIFKTAEKLWRRWKKDRAGLARQEQIWYNNG